MTTSGGGRATKRVLVALVGIPWTASGGSHPQAPAVPGRRLISWFDITQVCQYLDGAAQTYAGHDKAVAAALRGDGA